MKLKDLLNNRDKLKKYDELVEWREKFAKDADPHPMFSCMAIIPLASIPANVRQIILRSLESEIKKMEEE